MRSSSGLLPAAELYSFTWGAGRKEVDNCGAVFPGAEEEGAVTEAPASFALPLFHGPYLICSHGWSLQSLGPATTAPLHQPDCSEAERRFGGGGHCGMKGGLKQKPATTHSFALFSEKPKCTPSAPTPTASRPLRPDHLWTGSHPALSSHVLMSYVTNKTTKNKIISLNNVYLSRKLLRL